MMSCAASRSKNLFRRTPGIPAIARMLLCTAGFLLPATVSAQTVIDGTAETTNALYFVGSNTAYNTLTITNGGQLYVTNYGFMDISSIVGFHAPAGSNVVTVTGAGSEWTNNGNLRMGDTGIGNSLNIRDGARVENGIGIIGFNYFTSNNAVLVADAGSQWSNRSDLVVGYNGEGNSLVISNGATVWNAIGNVGFEFTGSNNMVLVTGSGSLWSNRSMLRMGYFSSGNALIVSNGGRVENTLGFVGGEMGASNNAVLVTGNGSLWSNRQDLTLGDLGAANTLTIRDGGGVENDAGWVGREISSSNNSALVTGAGAGWTNWNGLYVGVSGSVSTVTVSNGGTVRSGMSRVGNGIPSSNNAVVLTGGGSSWINGSNFFVGDAGAGNSLIITNGAVLRSGFDVTNDLFNAWAYIGHEASSSNNTVVVTGAGSLWTNRSIIQVGHSGAGNALTVSDGGRVVNDDSGGMGLDTSSSNNTVLVAGAGSAWLNSSNLYVGGAGSGNVLTISNGGMVGNIVGFVGANSSSNLVLVAGAGSLWTNRGDVLVGGGGGAWNVLTVSNGATVENSFGYMGSDSSSNTVFVTGAGSLWSNRADLHVGDSQSTGNTVVVSGGARVENGAALIGKEFGLSNAVLVTGSGSVWSNRSDLTVGYDQSAASTLTISNGGRVENGLARLGYNPFVQALKVSSSNAVLVTGSGSLWSNRSDVHVGYNETAASILTVRDGGTVENADATLGFATDASNNVVLVTGSGSLWTSRGSVTVGRSGAGNSLTVSNGGVVQVAGGMLVGENASSTNNSVSLSGSDSRIVVTNAGGAGVLDIRRGTLVQDAGTLMTDRLVMTNTFGAYQFNGGTAVVQGVTAGNGAAFQVGNGVTAALLRQTQAGVTNTFADGLQVNAGATFSFAGTLTNLVTLNGGTLAGTGTLTTDLTVGPGATVSPGNSPGTLTGSNVTFQGGGTYLWEINNFSGTQGGDPGWDWMNLGGALSITAVAGNEFNIDIISLTGANTPGNALNFYLLQDYSLTVLTASGGITGFDETAFSLNTAGFTNPTVGVWSIGQSGNSLVLTYTCTIPEPSAWALLALGAVCVLVSLGRRKRAAPAASAVTSRRDG